MIRSRKRCAEDRAMRADVALSWNAKDVDAIGRVESSRDVGVEITYLLDDAERWKKEGGDDDEHLTHTSNRARTPGCCRDRPTDRPPSPAKDSASSSQHRHGLGTSRDLQLCQAHTAARSLDWLSRSISRGPKPGLPDRSSCPALASRIDG
ncbi:hypothetical protein PaG_01987 [Moesziomyces aphidis]|uniref:Uncharacterized protein n=1 Tax=Moesziomyces aphidis TaxID=84754 RepID=W3VSA8_MOEAP|nr:hypothetical protein PaG_01987 [Moesziomyces aphidis]